MVKQVVLSQCGIRFNDAALREADIGIGDASFADPRQPSLGDLWKKGSQTSRPLSAEPDSEDADHSHNGHGSAKMWPRNQDVLTDSHDQLRSEKAWWLLEMLPTKYAWQEASGKWNAKWG